MEKALDKRNEENKRVCAYSNEYVVRLLGEASLGLKNTVKAMYNKDGALTWNGRAYAYAEYDDYFIAEAVHERFLEMRRGYDDFVQMFRRPSNRRSNEIYAWLANEHNLKLLKNKGAKIKEYAKIKVRELIDEKERQQAELDALCAQLKEEVDALQAKEELQKTELHRLMASLETTQREASDRQTQFEEQLAEKRQLLEQTEAERKYEQEKASAELTALERVQEDRELANAEKMKVLRRLETAQLNLLKAQREIEQHEQDVQKEDIQLQKMISKTRNMQTKIDNFSVENKKILEMVRKDREQRKKFEAFERLNESGFHMNERDCSMCMMDFTEPMSFEEQQAKNITKEQLHQLNVAESTDEHCWRNRTFPCGHAKMCGYCLHLIYEDAKEKGKPFQCGYCKLVIESFEVVRMSTKQGSSQETETAMLAPTPAVYIPPHKKRKPGKDWITLRETQ